ncbi:MULTISPECIES: phage holin family protein [Brevibacterium]|jgi:putative membrane protein|uniref:Phage holin family protein n=1 Tax=Brevibacterium salitolerans TaxID=1403566 RepID=A0ABN2WGQ5_9MICO|nr:phage holin family protein [Brevibacterium sp.]
MGFLIRTIVNALALAAAVWLLPGMDITGSTALADSVGERPAAVIAYLVVAIVFGLVNALVRPLVAFVSAPITCLTLGLFAIVVNALMITLTAWLSGFTPFVLEVEDFFWTAVLAAVVVAIVSAVLGRILPDADRARD